MALHVFIIHSCQYIFPKAQYSYSHVRPIYEFRLWIDFPKGLQNTPLRRQKILRMII